MTGDQIRMAQWSAGEPEVEAHNERVRLYCVAREEIAQILTVATKRRMANVMVSTDDLSAVVQMLTDYEDGITWQTTCTNCARLMNTNYAQYEELAKCREAGMVIEQERQRQVKLSHGHFEAHPK